MDTYPFPLRLRLAADPRFAEINHSDDQIWQLVAGGGDPAGLSVRTSYGLRSRDMRIFPSFGWRGRTRVDPGEFVEPIAVEAMLPNYARLKLIPFVDLQVILEYWVVDSQTLAGRVVLRNHGSSPEQHRLRLHAQLHPLEGGQLMSLTEYGGVEVLQGKTENLRPLLFLSGGAVAERVAIPALSVRHQLAAGEQVSVFWATCASSAPAEAFSRLRQLAESRWQAEIAKLELANRGIVQVESGDPVWDAAFHRSQQVALGLVVSGSTSLPNLTFVGSRLPDHGHSPRGDLKKVPESWSGQDVFASFQLAGNLLPAAPEYVEAFIRNFLYVQGARGEIDGRPGLAGQRAKFNAAPLLVSLAWRTYTRTQSDEFLREVYPALKEFIESWFSRSHDADGDGVPEWKNVLQTGFPDTPTFVRWSDWGEAVDVRTVESPDLIAYLLHDCRCLMLMAAKLGRTEDLPDLETKATGLRRALARAWDEDLGLHLPLDRDLHVAQKEKQLAKGKGNFTKKVGAKFDPMVRLVVRSTGPEADAKDLAVTIHGRGPKGQFRKERLEGRQFDWFWDFGSATSENTFASIEKIQVSGITKSFNTVVGLANHRRPDASWLQVLWADAPAAEASHTLLGIMTGENYWRPYGLATVPQDDPIYGDSEAQHSWGVHVGLNERLAAGLIELGERELAAELLGRLMDGVAGTLAAGGVFRDYYHPEQISPSGEADTALGLAPLDAFLQVLGVSLESPWSVKVAGVNPFSEPITLRWRGMQVFRPPDRPGWIRFPDGEQVEITGTASQRISRVR